MALEPPLRALGHLVTRIPLEHLAALTASPSDALVVVPDREARGVSHRELADRLQEALGRRWPAIVVLVSSAAVYEANHHHPGLARESQLRAPRHGNPLALRWQALEAELSDRLHVGPPLVVLRPPATPVPAGTDFFSRLLRRRWALVLPGHDPSLQLLAPKDLARAISHAAAHGRNGLFNLAPRGVIPLRRALRGAGVTAVPVPRLLQGAMRAMLRLATPRIESVARLDSIRFSWTVSGELARAKLGFEPELSSAEVVIRTDGSSETYDDYGLDRAYVETWCRTALRFFHDVYWRVEVEGLEHVPREGPVVLVGVHRGFVPCDALLAVYDLLRHRGRIPRFLIHPGLLRFPFVFDFITRFGGVLACRENAERILSRGEVLGVFPEGVGGAFRLYRNAYSLGRFAGDEFLRAALRHGAPLVPFVTVGSAEAFPIIGKLEWRWWRRFAEWPFLPITPTLLPVPLPSKWHTRFLPPLAELRDLPPAAAADPRVIRCLRARVRAILAAEMASIRARRPGIFHGSVFGRSAPEERDPR